MTFIIELIESYSTLYGGVMAVHRMTLSLTKGLFVLLLSR